MADVERYLAVPYATRRNAAGYGDFRSGFGVQRFVSFPYLIYSREHRLLRVGVLKTAVARVLSVPAEAEVCWNLPGTPPWGRVGPLERRESGTKTLEEAPWWLLGLHQ